ncbi:inositol monophosphatase family protein [Stackebrandtia nassauensis]|uniref:inositol monophosphatase family protein n=1 Tax=Stackebrandtia nassauensis TaxID=283811 RepID=UPI001B7FAEFA|nr:inositol monophosphatase family protein [Stackebrandtia nassauensis]
MPDIPPVDQKLLAFAVRTVWEAGEVSAARFFSGSRTVTKSDGSVVTDTDLEVEKLILGRLAERYPEDGSLGEETGEHTGRSGRRWIVDPISGTAFFVLRMPLFANLLAYEDEHGPAVGIVNLPMQRELVYAGRGLGCWRITEADGQPVACRVGDRPNAKGALTLAMNQQTWSTELVAALHGHVDLVGAINHPVVHLVTGRVDAMVMTGQGYDDRAGLPLIVEEAGGVVTDLDGAPLLSGDGSVLATNGRWHEELVDLVKGLPRLKSPR